MAIDDDHQGFLKECGIFNIKSGGITPGQVTRQLAYNGGNQVVLASGRPIVNTDSLDNNAFKVDPDAQQVTTDYSLHSPNLDALQSETDAHIADLSNPHQTSLQQAYMQNALINLAFASPLAVYTSVGTQGMICGDKGTQSHLPVYSLTASSLNLTADLIDTIFQNQASTMANTIVIQAATTYSVSAYFQVIAQTWPIVVQAEAGVILNGTNGGAFTALPGQAWECFQIDDVGKQWTAINLQPIGGVGIDVDNGVINATGGGSAVVCGFSATLLGALLNSTGDGTLVDVICNNELFNIGSAYNPSTGIFTAPLNAVYMFITNVFMDNLSASHTQYLFYTNIDGTTYMMAQGNPANERSAASSQMTRRGTLLIQLNAGQQVKLQVEVDGSSKTATIGSGAQPTSFSGYLMGLISGTPGVQSINTLSGILTTSSPDNSVTITSIAGNLAFKTNLVGTTFSPALTNVQGTSASSVVSGIINQKTFSGKITISGTTDSSGTLVKINFPLPVATANLEGCVTSVVKTSLLDAGGGTATGSGRPLILIDPNTAQIVFEGGEQNTAYTVNASFDYIPS